MKHDSESYPPIILGAVREVKLLTTAKKYRIVIKLDGTDIDARMHFDIQPASKYHRKAVIGFLEYGAGWGRWINCQVAVRTFTTDLLIRETSQNMAPRLKGGTVYVVVLDLHPAQKLLVPVPYLDKTWIFKK